VQSQKLEALGQLTSGIAHDFNNIIAAIAGGFSVIERRIQDPRVAEVARHGAQAAERGGALVRQLLAFARQQSLAPLVVDLRALLREAEPLIARSLGPGVEVEIRCPDGLGRLRLDPVQLETALINLAVNARDAMPRGGHVRIEARACPPDEAGRPSELGPRPGVAIAVSDTGGGIPPEILARVVEPFFTTKGPGRGTGLGLAMVHGFVGQSEGALRIASEPGEGTTVTLYLPEAAEALPESPRALPEPMALRAAPGMTVLLVDDDPAVRGVTAAQLSDLGYAVLEADGAPEALSLLGAGVPVDGVLTDVAMPGQDGISLAAEIRHRRPDLPILFMTGHADRARLLGEAVIDKPFSLPTLALALAERIAAGRRLRA
jgi:CheY-like chemotaxis protein